MVLSLFNIKSETDAFSFLFNIYFLLNKILINYPRKLFFLLLIIIFKLKILKVFYFIY